MQNNKNLDEIKSQLANVLKKYSENKDNFLPYYEGMNILTSSNYKEQLGDILKEIQKKDKDQVRSFEMYLDTIIINLHTKVKKYKQSIYLDDANIKDIQNQGYTIPFFIDERNQKYILLGILKSKS